MAKKVNFKNSGKSRKKAYIILILIILAAIFIPRLLDKTNLEKAKNEAIPNAVKLAIGDANVKYEVKEVKERSGVYEFKLSIGEGENIQEYTSFITKDGKILFTSGIELEELANQTTTTTKKLTCDELDKADKPTLTAFVVSECPFGLQMQRLYSKVLTELPEIASYLQIKYIGSVEDGKITAMHGDQEAQENLRQICIREEQSSLYWPYVNCYMKAEGQSQACLTQTGVNQTSLDSCMTDANKGLKYAQADFDLASKLGVTGSPGLVLNDKQTVSEFDFGGRVADSIKQIICCGSTTKPAFCDQTLSTTEVASSYSETIESTIEGSTDASCN